MTNSTVRFHNYDNLKQLAAISIVEKLMLRNIVGALFLVRTSGWQQRTPPQSTKLGEI